MAELNTGKLTQIIGAVLDVRFSEGKLPEINDAIKVPLKDGEELVVVSLSVPPSESVQALCLAILMV